MSTVPVPKGENFISRVFNSIFFYIFLVFFISLGTGYLLLNSQAKGILVEQMLHREQLATRAGAISINTFFNLYDKAFAELVTRSEIIEFSPEAEQIINDFMARWDGSPVAGVIILDKDGIVRFNGNRDLIPNVAVSLADRDYFGRAKTAKAGDILISSPIVSRLGASVGKYIVTVSTPIFSQNGSFEGVLSSSIILDELTNQFITSLKITDKSFEYLLNESGDVLGTDQQGILGVNFVDQLSKNPFVGSLLLGDKLKKILSSRMEGKLEVAYPSDIKLQLPKPMLVAYSPLDIGDNHLMLAISTPTDDALIFLFPVYARSVKIIAGAFFIILLLGIRIAKIRGYQERVEEEHRAHTNISL